MTFVVSNLGYDRLRLVAVVHCKKKKKNLEREFHKYRDFSRLPEIKIKISYFPSRIVIFKIIFQDMHETTEYDLRQTGMK